MDCNHHSTGTADVRISLTNEEVTSLAELPLTLPSAGIGDSPVPAQRSLAPAAPKQPGSPQLCYHNGDNDPTVPDTLVPGLTPNYCATITTLGSKELNCHVSRENNVYRWSIANAPIPVGVHRSSFENFEEGIGSLVERCLIIVLGKFNDNHVGPKFQFVSDPIDSAFVVSFGGRHGPYARSFFPDSDPKDWYIYVYGQGLTLCQEQSDSLLNDTGGDIQLETARLQALEQKLVKILIHEMLHVLGVRHCDAHLTEKEPCVRFPPNLTDDENNEERLMQRLLHWKDLSRIDFDWNHRTLVEIRQIYEEERTHVGGHRIRDVSWQDGAMERKEIGRNNAACCTPKSENSKWGLLMRAVVSWFLAGPRNITRYWFQELHVRRTKESG